jgi:hydroxyacylglutathione hydrolase
METPGHTPESISIQVFRHATDSVPYGVLTGDALFIGDVGRPDLLASAGHTAEELGRMLHTSIGRLMTLPDDVRVFPPTERARPAARISPPSGRRRSAASAWAITPASP